MQSFVDYMYEKHPEYLNGVITNSGAFLSHSNSSDSDSGYKTSALKFGKADLIILNDSLYTSNKLE